VLRQNVRLQPLARHRCDGAVVSATLSQKNGENRLSWVPEMSPDGQPAHRLSRLHNPGYRPQTLPGSRGKCGCKPESSAEPLFGPHHLIRAPEGANFADSGTLIESGVYRMDISFKLGG
jgi:hypothetical protein